MKKGNQKVGTYLGFDVYQLSEQQGQRADIHWMELHSTGVRGKKRAQGRRATNGRRHDPGNLRRAAP